MLGVNPPDLAGRNSEDRLRSLRWNAHHHFRTPLRGLVVVDTPVFAVLSEAETQAGVAAISEALAQSIHQIQRIGSNDWTHHTHDDLTTNEAITPGHRDDAFSTGGHLAQNRGGHER